MTFNKNFLNIDNVYIVGIEIDELQQEEAEISFLLFGGDFDKIKDITINDFGNGNGRVENKIWDRLRAIKDSVNLYSNDFVLTKNTVFFEWLSFFKVILKHNKIIDVFSDNSETKTEEYFLEEIRKKLIGKRIHFDKAKECIKLKRFYLDEKCLSSVEENLELLLNSK